MFRKILRSQRGQGLTEYAMLLGLIALAAVAAMTLFGRMLIDTFYTLINDAFPGA